MLVHVPTVHVQRLAEIAHELDHLAKRFLDNLLLLFTELLALGQDGSLHALNEASGVCHRSRVVGLVGIAQPVRPREVEGLLLQHPDEFREVGVPPD